MHHSLARTTLCGLLFVGLLCVSGCANKYKKKVVGTWKTDMPFNPEFTFKEDGTGSMSVMGQSQDFKWRMRGSNLILKIEGQDKEVGGVIKSIDEKEFVLYDKESKSQKNATFTRVK